MIGSFYFKRLSRFLVYMLIPTVLVCAFSFAIFLRSIDKNLIQEGTKTVSSVTTNFDLVISNILHQNDMLTNSSRVSQALQKMLTQSDLSYWDAIYLDSLRMALNSIVSAHTYIDSIYFYLDSGAYYFSSGDGIMNISISSDASWFGLYGNMPVDETTIIVKRKQNRMIESMETISVFKRFLIQKGCTIININIEKFRRMLKSMRSNLYESIVILDANGSILLADSDKSDDLERIRKCVEEGLSDNGIPKPEKLLGLSGTWVKMGSGRYLLNIEKYPTENLYILSLISDEARVPFITSALKTYLMVLVANFCLIFLLSFLITKRTFDQIDYINTVFENAEQGVFTDYDEAPVKDEYGLILNKIIHLFVNTTYLHAQLSEKEYSRHAAELQALQLQINPHFLFNTLQTLQLEIRRMVPDGDDLCAALGNVSDILKYAVSDPQEPVSLLTEIQYLKKYVEIQRFRFGDRFIIYYELDDGVEDAEVFKLLLQPLVENSLRYGMAGIEGKVYIKVVAERRGGRLEFLVEDNGSGMSTEKVQEVITRINSPASGHIGLQNVHKRLVLKYGIDSGLRLASGPGGGTSVSFSIPLTALSAKGVNSYDADNN
jgi:two-component system, sensor histidine kinase YesM